MLGFLRSVSSFPMQHDNAISFEKHLLAKLQPRTWPWFGVFGEFASTPPPRARTTRDQAGRPGTRADFGAAPSRGENLLSSGKCLQSDAVSPLSAGQVIKLTRVIAIYGLTATTNVTGSPRASGCT